MATTRLFSRGWPIVGVALCLISVGASRSLAQVTTAITPTSGAGSLGTAVTQAGATYQITGGTRPGNGPNLFHSFGQFNVGRPDTAQFLNTTPQLTTANILARVTGGSASNIFGTIDMLSYSGANLFLMNPAGIIFGPTATLNVGGMATFTTADYLRLADGNFFHATPNAAADALLSVAPVAAFGFLGSNSAAITVQGSHLSVSAGKGLALVGGNITVQNGTLEDGTVQAAQISAPGGKSYLASTGSPGEFITATLEQAPNIKGQSFATLGTIQVSQKSIIDASGDGGGTVIIRGGQFLLNDSQISANTTRPTQGPLVGQPGAGIDIQVAQDAVIQNGAVLETNVAANVAPGIGSGGVHVKADRIEILGVPSTPTPFTGIRSVVASGSTGGSSGDIRLEANSFLINNSARVQTTTGGAGNAGNIFVHAADNIEILDKAVISSTSGILPPPSPGTLPLVSGNAGNIELTSTHGNISVSNLGTITSQATLFTRGNTGKIMVSAAGDIVVETASIFTANGSPDTGAGGQIEIRGNNLRLHGSITDDNAGPMKPRGITVTLANDLTLSGGSTLATTSRSRVGAAAGDLTITAKNIQVTQGSIISSETFRSGEGGRLAIFTDNLQVTDRGQVKSGSTINPQSATRELPTGAGGSMTIQGLTGPMGSVLIDGTGSGIFANAQGTGAGGNTNITAQSVTIQNGGTISASTSGTTASATGGNIAITAGQFVMLNNGGSITASSTGLANAGNIVINAGQNFTSTNSSVTTSAVQASGGNITVLASDMIHLTNSQINASVQGSSTTIGGNVTIDPNFVILQNSQILAQATQGQGGNISITTGSLLTDPSSTIDASSQFGVNGNVTVQSPISQAGGKIVPLSKTTLETTALLSQRCAALASGQYSSFVVAGRDALPAEPGGWLTSPLVALNVTASEVGSAPRGLPPDTEDSSIVSVRRLWSAGSLAILASTDWLAGCGS